MGKWFLLGVLLSIAAWPAAEPSPIGTYTCSGTQAGKPYTLRLEVTAFDKTYELAWQTADGSQAVLAGVAVKDGSVLAVALISPAGGIGAALYHISPGRLDGIWTRGDGTIDPEVCASGKAA